MRRWHSGARPAPNPAAAARIQTTGSPWRTLLMIGRHHAAEGGFAPVLEESSAPWLTVQRGSAPLLLCMPHTGTHIPEAVEAALASPWLARKDTDWWIERLRSEERRVGKEGRSRWAPDH